MGQDDPMDGNSNMAPPSSATRRTGEKTSSKQEDPVDDANDFPPVPYKKPSWAAPLKRHVWFEVLKSGTIIEKLELDEKKDCILVGRLPNTDIIMEHASISRYHAVIQCGDDNEVYIYDLGSTHGTKINKSTISPRKYFRLRLGHMVQFGASSRVYILQASNSEMAAEESRLADVESRAKDKMKETREQEEQTAARGVSWGMDGEDDVAADDADPEGGNSTVKGTDTPLNADGEPYYTDDPKKALRVYFEREAAHLDYECDMSGPGHARVYTCKIHLPVDTPDGNQLVAEASVQGKKRDAIVAAALEACKMLDARGVLKNSDVAETRRVKRRARENEADSDDDTFYDRTGEIEAKRRRKERQKITTLTYENLSESKAKLLTQLRAIREKLDAEKRDVASDASNADVDPLDAFIKGMQKQPNKDLVLRLKREQRDLGKELAEIESMLAVVTPALKPLDPSVTSPVDVVPAGGAHVDAAKATAPETAVGVAVGVAPDATPQRPEGTARDGANKHASVGANGGGVDERVSVVAAEAVPTCSTTTASHAAPSVYAAEKSSMPPPPPPPHTSTRSKDVKLPAGSLAEAVATVKDQPSQPPVKRVYGVARPTDAQLAAAAASMDRQAGVTKDSTWVAPKGQSGDGRTHLNEKLGY
eukprot:m.1402380 g.1402380  ORF g.1402380 m.1402380 type:complete len:649 (-) comp25010_c0_seq3:7729-9675(-)